MKRIGKASAAAITLFAAFLLTGCGGKAEQPDANANAEQTKKEGERVNNGQAEHYQEMQQKKQQGNGGQ